MKKTFIILLLFAMIVTFSACGGEAEQQNETVPETGLNEELIESGSVSDVLAAISAENIGEFSTTDFDRGAFAEALNNAAENEIEAEAAMELGAVDVLSEELPNNTPWWTSFHVLVNGKEFGNITIFENNKTNMTTVVLKRGTTSTAFYENDELYDLIRRADEADLVVDGEAFEKYGAIAKESTENSFENEKRDFGITDIKLVHFEKIWEDNNDEGNNFALYEYEYSVGVEDPDMFMLVGGMRFDYEMRIRSFNGFYGQLAVKEKDGEIINTALLVNDEMVYPKGADEEQLKHIKEVVTGKLAN
ncbi:MAG: hypothetical protein IIU36_05615 [Firmicutes bacterium]|nr:hypothetical protein [Bacillota bacterium]